MVSAVPLVAQKAGRDVDGFTCTNGNQAATIISFDNGNWILDMPRPITGHRIP